MAERTSKSNGCVWYSDVAHITSTHSPLGRLYHMSEPRVNVVVLWSLPSKWHSNSNGNKDKHLITKGASVWEQSYNLSEQFTSLLPLISL